MANKRTASRGGKKAGSRGPSAELLMKRLGDAGILKLDATLGDIMKQISAIERDMGRVSWTAIVDSKKWCIVMP